MIHNSRLPEYVNDLVNARKEKKLTQAQLAKIVYCEPSYLSKIETGKALAGGQLLCRLCDALGKIIRLV